MSDPETKGIFSGLSATDVAALNEFAIAMGLEVEFEGSKDQSSQFPQDIEFVSGYSSLADFPHVSTISSPDQLIVKRHFLQLIARNTRSVASLAFNNMGSIPAFSAWIVKRIVLGFMDREARFPVLSYEK